MPAKAAKTQSHSKQPISDLSELHDGARLIADEKGDILFATESFLSICEISDPVHNDNIAFVFEEDPIANNDLQITTIKPSGKKIALQFDWVEIKKGERYLIASAEEITAREKLKQYVAKKVEEKKNASAQNDVNPYPFMEMSQDICLVSDFEGQFIYKNSASSKLFGLNGDNITSFNFLDIVHEEDRPFVHRALQDFRQNAEDIDDASFDFDARMISNDGSLHWIHWQFQSNQDNIFSLGRDITAIKKQKERLERQQRELSEAEAIAHMGHWRWRVGNETLRLSHEIYRMFGFENKEDFDPTLDNITSMIYREDAGRMTQVFQRAMIEQNDYEIDFRLTRSDGETRYIRCEGRCEVDDEYDVIALYGIMQDVTDTILKENDLRKAKDSAERAYAAKSQFLANMSHELRTPLNAIIGFSEMMQHQLLGPIGNDKYIEYISGIRESGEHLLDLISDILDMSKIEAGKYELNLEKFNLIKTIKLALHMMESRALDENVKLFADVKGEDLEIIADRRAVMQMILNLLSNSVKFTKEDGKVTLKCSEESDYIDIAIIDNGIGIPANKLMNITKPFEQVECSYTREYEGSGLGLSITKELAEAHGGNLYIESELDVGTTVTIRLPYQAVTQKQEN
ncbi:MAG: PAS domain-containing protein [Alphaproteobacteria bacterium]|nr:PAS domain-containing protein [Alphaproteobacteria bacterium]